MDQSLHLLRILWYPQLLGTKRLTYLLIHPCFIQASFFVRLSDDNLQRNETYRSSRGL